MRQEWRSISGGTVQVTIYSGGVLGDETEMVRQIRQGRIQAVGLSSVGLSRIDNGVSCLQVPMMFRSYEELDYVRDRIAPTLERRIEAKGFKVLNWADGGWVHTFTKKRGADAGRLAAAEAVHLGGRSGDRAPVQGVRLSGRAAVAHRHGHVAPDGHDRRVLDGPAVRPAPGVVQARAPHERPAVDAARRRHGDQPGRPGTRFPRPTRPAMLEAARTRGRSAARRHPAHGRRRGARNGEAGPDRSSRSTSHTRALWQTTAEQCLSAAARLATARPTSSTRSAAPGRVPRQDRMTARSYDRVAENAVAVAVLAAMAALALVEVGGRLAVGHGIPGSHRPRAAPHAVGGHARRRAGRAVRSAARAVDATVPARARARSASGFAVGARWRHHRRLCLREHRPGPDRARRRRHRRLGHPSRGSSLRCCRSGFAAITVPPGRGTPPDSVRGRLVRRVAVSRLPLAVRRVAAVSCAACCSRRRSSCSLAATALGMPIFAAIGGAALLLFWGDGTPINAVPGEAYRLTTSPMLPAIPLFALGGYILAEGGASQRLTAALHRARSAGCLAAWRSSRPRCSPSSRR